MKKVVIKNLNKIYGPRSILKDINLDIEAGEIISILGPSGSGKTTLIRCLLGLEEFDGAIQVDGLDLPEYLKSRRIGYVPQKYSNFEHLTVSQNLETALEKVSGARGTQAKTAKVEHALEKFGLRDHSHQYPRSLSGGMNQRLAIARALLSDSDIIVFDEPLSALDEMTKHKIQEFLLDLWRTHKKTFIFITHDIEEAIFLSKKIIVLDINPGTIIQEEHVPFPYPRDHSMRFASEFQEIRKRVSRIESQAPFSLSNPSS